MKNFQSYKGRFISDGQRVRVYFNLHNKKYSAVAVKGPDKGKVLGYFDRVTLRFVKFIVSEVGKKSGFRKKRKNSHSYAVGSILSMDQEWPMALFLKESYERGVARVGRLSSRGDKFYSNNRPVDHAYMVALDPDGSYVDRYLKLGESPWWTSLIEDKN